MRLTLKVVLWRGLAAGAIAGAVTAVFVRVVTGVQTSHGVDFERAASLGLGPGVRAEFGRPLYELDGALVAVTSGMLFGVITAVVLTVLHEHLRSRDEFGRALKVSVGLLLAIGVLPALKYPANPPGVGDPDTLGLRAALYASFLVASAVIVLATWWAWNRATERGHTGGSRFLRTGAFGLFLLSAAFFIWPAPPDRVEPPINEAAPALEVSPGAPPEVLDAMLANAREIDDESYRNPADVDQPLDVDRLSDGSDLAGAPVAISTAKLTPPAFTTMVWSYRVRSMVAMVLLWSVLASALGMFLDRWRSQQPALD